MRAALDKFEKMNPGIKVELQRIAWGNAREQFLREAAVGEGPDVVHIAQVWTRSMGDAGALYDMNELIEEHGIGEGWGDFISADLASQDDGTIHAIRRLADIESIGDSKIGRRCRLAHVVALYSHFLADPCDLIFQQGLGRDGWKIGRMVGRQGIYILWVNRHHFAVPHLDMAFAGL